MHKDFSKDVLVVTGGTGFVGNIFMRKVRELNFKEVRIVRSKDHDLRDANQAANVVDGATYVVHIAGITGGIEFTRQNQGSIYYDNIMMNTNIVHQCMLSKVKKLISVGTVCSYPKFAQTPFKEDEIWSGYPEEVNSHYGMAKKMLMVQGEAYKNQYGLDSQVLLFTNLYGIGDHFDKNRSHVIPALIVKFYEAIKEGRKEVTLWGTGEPTRDVLFAEDAADSLICALDSDSDALAINVGSGEEVSIKDLANMIKEFMGGKFQIHWDVSKPNGQPRRMLDTTRTEAEIGFKRKICLKEGLQRTIQWYIESREKQTAHV